MTVFPTLAPVNQTFGPGLRALSPAQQQVLSSPSRELLLAPPQGNRSQKGRDWWGHAPRVPSPLLCALSHSAGRETRLVTTSLSIPGDAGGKPFAGLGTPFLSLLLPRGSPTWKWKGYF